MSKICIDLKVQPSKVYYNEGQNKNYDVEFTETVQFKHFKPFLISMKIFGLNYTKEYCRNNAKEESIHKPHLRNRVTPSFIFATAILILLWSNFFKLFTCYRNGGEFGAHFFIKTGFVAWTVLCCLNISSCWLGCFRYENLPQFFEKWSNFQQENKETRKQCIPFILFYFQVNQKSLILPCLTISTLQRKQLRQLNAKYF